MLALIAEGATNSQIADRLVIAESTAKSHVKRILRRLGAANRVEAASIYLRSTPRGALGEVRLLGRVEAAGLEPAAGQAGARQRARALAAGARRPAAA